MNQKSDKEGMENPSNLDIWQMKNRFGDKNRIMYDSYFMSNLLSHIWKNNRDLGFGSKKMIFEKNIFYIFKYLFHIK